MLYLKPKTKWLYSDEFWFEKRAVGHNTLASTFKRIRKLVGLEGNYSNHSGRATAATALMKAGIPDKLALERTGHRTLESLREYQTLDIQDTRRVSATLSSCDQFATCSVGNATSPSCNDPNESNLTFPDFFNDSEETDLFLSQALQSYEVNTNCAPKVSTNINLPNLTTLFSNSPIGTVNIYIGKHE